MDKQNLNNIDNEIEKKYKKKDKKKKKTMKISGANTKKLHKIIQDKSKK